MSDDALLAGPTVSLPKSELDANCRTFLLKSYPVIKKHNPYVPVLIREAFGVPARAYVRYGILGAHLSINL
jgi:Mitochondrial ribosomal protein L51 / S25 / CI-B8 domain